MSIAQRRCPGIERKGNPKKLGCSGVCLAGSLPPFTHFASLDAPEGVSIQSGPDVYKTHANRLQIRIDA
eukprot:CAMPEP_0182851860 /NCGR_PEP_ID=MMETSP0006_2-20121128/30849_1 /TAXON_ID=97485 /ORGANISM="Prymnesium parvum, Strain Texoma1" /LENGTH=68 /DNA_ID=CAMNT_0024982553 /DNA_START=414 /DNA_END=617 /DNA_ORIENTATION=+